MADKEGCRLQHPRSVLPCEVRVVAVHPLAGRVLMARWFKHLDGVVVPGVELPDGSAATVPAVVTDVCGVMSAGGPALVVDAEGLRALRVLTARLVGKARGPEKGAGR
jgi:hypothetical protein